MKLSIRNTGLTLAACIGFAALTSQAEDMAPLAIKLPKPAPKGTVLDVPTGNIDPFSISTNRAPFMAPKDVTNLALKKRATTSDTNCNPERLSMVSDGDKEVDKVLQLRKGNQYVQFDLEQKSEIFAVVIWHAFDTPKVYHRVVVQVSDTPDFTGDVKTVFNNDNDNTTGHGIGADKEYFETHFGKLIDTKGAQGRYVRFYTKGSTESALNEYTEIEIYGRPAK
jgi:hypothetical protein